jgi:hypothetical protein
MGTLTPGATLIYERVDDIVYSREAGSHPSTRREVGRKWPGNTEDTFFGMPVKEVGKLVSMAQAAKTNPALQKALEQCIIIYHLSNPPEQPIQHHPV